MPLVDLSDPRHLGIICGAEGQWGHPGDRAQVRLTYARFHVVPMLRERWGWLVPLLGLTPQSSVCLIGAGYGYSLEVLEDDHGITRVIGTEPSPLRAKAAQSEDAEIQAAIEAVGLSVATGDGARLFSALRDRPGLPRATRASDVLSEDLASNASRTRVRQALQAKGAASWDVITENVLTVLSDAECVALSSRLRQLSGVNRVIHLTSTRVPPESEAIQDPIYNWKSVAEWKALLPADLIVSLYTRGLA